LELSFVIFFGLPSIRLSYFYDPNRRVWLAYLVYWIFCFFALFLNWLFFSNFIHLLLIYLELDISSFFICFLLTYPDIMIWLIYIASSLKLAQVSFFFPFLFFQFLFPFFFICLAWILASSPFMFWWLFFLCEAVTCIHSRLSL